MNEVVEIAKALASASYDPDVKLLARFWDRAEGMADTKSELLRQAKTVLGSGALTGELKNTKSLPKGYKVGGWIKHYNGEWVGRILSIYREQLLVSVHWYGMPGTTNKKNESFSAGISLGELKRHAPLAERPKDLVT